MKRKLPEAEAMFAIDPAFQRGEGSGWHVICPNPKCPKIHHCLNPKTYNQKIICPCGTTFKVV